MVDKQVVGKDIAQAQVLETRSALAIRMISRISTRRHDDARPRIGKQRLTVRNTSVRIRVKSKVKV